MWVFYILMRPWRAWQQIHGSNRLAETDEVVKTTIKISPSSALRKRLFHLFFLLFDDIDTHDTRLHQFYTTISTHNAILEQIK
jgi:hypothetical protein